jgi:hypothetical protein
VCLACRRLWVGVQHTHTYTPTKGEKKKEVLFEELIIYTEISKESGREDY